MSDQNSVVDLSNTADMTKSDEIDAVSTVSAVSHRPVDEAVLQWQGFDVASYIDGLPYVDSVPRTTATIRQKSDDFQVDEEISFEFSGAGEHAYLRVKKTNLNTDWVAKQLAQFARVRVSNVGYAGLKDRHAVTTQWFSIQCSGVDKPDWSQFSYEMDDGEIEIMESHWHQRKLKRGALTGNRFMLRLRDIQSLEAGVTAQSLLNPRIERLSQGVPNYFGIQRFGRQNLQNAARLFTRSRPPRHKRDRQKQGMYLSAARSYLFNAVLARRVTEQSWDQALPGEALVLDGSHSFFVAETIDEVILDRLQRFDVHPSAPLWGKGECPALLGAHQLEVDALKPYDFFREGLIKQGLRHERRALRLVPQSIESHWEDEQTLVLRFTLPPGSYATTVMRELSLLNNAQAL